MTAEQEVVLLIKGALSELPADQQEKVRGCIAHLRLILKDYGEAGQMALALVGAECAAGAGNA